jgi:superfamily II DNA helicase RecQ
MPGTPIPEEFIPPVPTKSIPTNHIPIVSRREEIESILLDKFRLRGFIPNQYEAITATMDEQDILVVLPSGSSRNVCYQLPILFQHPKLITVVLVPSPIDLLEKDDHTIETHEIPTLFVCKSKKTYKKNWISRSELTLDVLKQTQLIYMTFNDFGKCKKIIQSIYKSNLLSRFIIDQVHCISQWGDDFYFGYLRTTEDLKETYASIPITALTAIPNERIHLDIIHQLKLKQCKIFKKSILF